MGTNLLHDVKEIVAALRIRIAVVIAYVAVTAIFRWSGNSVECEE